MPIYEFDCSKCDKTSEHLLKMSDPHPDQCPHCHATKTLSKKLSKTSFILKGGGWYSDAYSDKGKTSAKTDKPKSDSTSAAGETKSASKADAAPAATTTTKND